VIDTGGTITLRHNGRLHHIGVGLTHARTPILMLINGHHIIHATTGQIIRELTLNPAVDYQARGVTKPQQTPPWGSRRPVCLATSQGRRMRDSNPRGREPNPLSKSARRGSEESAVSGLRLPSEQSNAHRRKQTEATETKTETAQS
jgi:hypothetical protein